MQDPDPRVLARARAGDVLAFEDLVRAYQGDVWRFAYHLTRDRVMAEDVTQEAFLRAYRFLGSFRGEARFTSWLLRIVRNCGMDALRRQASQRARQPAPGPPATDPAARAELDEAIGGLVEDHRQPFLLIEVFGLSYREAADVLRLPVGTVKSRMHRARLALVRALSDQEEAGGGAGPGEDEAGAGDGGPGGP
ncbi:MAG: sigma-70 family RNA polymerase sigma factor [Actinobacteria bacterium]|nr:sigma-70 family RNA polymerase sigma factor [Actinomycetota bacterium]